jgi:hypothetical protein
MNNQDLVRRIQDSSYSEAVILLNNYTLDIAASVAKSVSDSIVSAADAERVSINNELENIGREL